MIASQDYSARKPTRYQRADVREQMILKSARDVFLSEGWDRFSIERIAEFMECSRSLIYAHFPSKEEILLALSNESTRLRIQLSKKALEFKGRSRERFLAYGQIDRLMVPRHLPVTLLVLTTRHRSKVSEARQEESSQLIQESVALGASIIREAIEAGDLNLPASVSPEELYFSVFSFTFGGINIIQSDFPMAQAGVDHPGRAIHKSLGLMLDGYGWRPLTSEWDYMATLDRVRKEVFESEETLKLLSA